MAERVGGGLQNMVVMELCEGGSLLKVLQSDDGRRRPREFGWCATLCCCMAIFRMCTVSLGLEHTCKAYGPGGGSAGIPKFALAWLLSLVHSL